MYFSFRFLLMQITLILTILSMPTVASARPVSYPGGWTIMQKANRHIQSLHIHYSPHFRYSLGYRFEHLENETLVDYLHLFQYNRLEKRWNKFASQANLYTKFGLGLSDNHFNKKTEVYFAGIAADWETQRYFLSYENRYLDGEYIESNLQQKFRMGVAPYIGNYGDLHTWFIFENQHLSNNQGELRLSPLIRLFQSTYLIEVGIDNQGNGLFNSIIRF